MKKSKSTVRKRYSFQSYKFENTNNRNHASPENDAPCGPAVDAALYARQGFLVGIDLLAG